MKESCTVYSLIFMIEMFKKGEDHMYCSAFNFDHLLYFVCVASFFLFLQLRWPEFDLKPSVTNFIFPRKPVNVGSHLVVHILCVKKSANVTSHLLNDHFYVFLCAPNFTNSTIVLWHKLGATVMVEIFLHPCRTITNTWQNKTPYDGSARMQRLPNDKIYWEFACFHPVYVTPDCSCWSENHEI